MTPHKRALYSDNEQRYEYDIKRLCFAFKHAVRNLTRGRTPSRPSSFVCLCNRRNVFAPEMALTMKAVLMKFYDEYQNTTAKKLKIIDAYLLYIMLTGVVQFVYCLLVGTFPFNSFLSGFISCVGCFVLAVCLRLQVNPQNKGQFLGISPERGFADFIFAHIVLHLVVVNFIG